MIADHPDSNGVAVSRIGCRAVLALSSLAISTTALLGACGGGDGSNDGRRTQVVTTLPVFADFVREIGGDRVDVTSLIPTGVNPGNWQAAPDDAKRVGEADIAFANGHDFEPAAMEVLLANLRPRAPLVQIAGDDDALERAGAEILHETVAGGHQPVLWMNIQNGKAYAQFIRQELSELDPEGDKEYTRNAERYFERIDETERYAFKRLDSIPPENKKLISTDTSLEYFGSYYAIELTAQLSLYPGQQLTEEDVTRIKHEIEERDVLAVFERAEPFTDDVLVVDEDVLSVFLRNESPPFLHVEPLHGAGRHLETPWIR